MDAVFVAIGVAFMIWGLLALIATWAWPALRSHALMKGVLLTGKVEPARLAHTLAASIPLLFGAFLTLTSLDSPLPRWPIAILLFVFFIAAVALHLQRHDV